jgi:hypothetical protein
MDPETPAGVATPSTAPHNFPPVLQGKQFVQYSPTSSAFGTPHPADVDLGKARFMGGLASSATGSKPSTGDMLHNARSLMAAGPSVQGAPNG